MEPEYLRKFLALGLAGVWTPSRQSVGKLARVVLMIDDLYNQGQHCVFKPVWHQCAISLKTS